jgi:hypothetical protein
VLPKDDVPEFVMLVENKDPQVIEFVPQDIVPEETKDETEVVPSELVPEFEMLDENIEPQVIEFVPQEIVPLEFRDETLADPRLEVVATILVILELVNELEVALTLLKVRLLEVPIS